MLNVIELKIKTNPFHVFLQIFIPYSKTIDHFMVFERYWAHSFPPSSLDRRCLMFIVSPQEGGRMQPLLEKCIGFLISWFFVSCGFKDLWFLGFLVYWSLSFLVYWFQSFLVSWFRSFLVSRYQSFLVYWIQSLFVSWFQSLNDPILANFHFMFSGTY